MKRLWHNAKYFWNMFLAETRLSQNAVCMMSHGKSPYSDYHDYPDSAISRPIHGYRYTCKHCGKEFYV